MGYPVELPRNPASPEAISINDLERGLSFAVIDSTGSTALKGVITELPNYNGEEWHGAKFVGIEGEQELDLYETGIVCSRQGVWTDSHAIAPESQEIDLT